MLPSARRAGPKTHTAELALGETFRDVRPLAESTPTFRELALDCDARGELVVVGGAGGEVTAWDPRCARAAWVAEAFSRRDTENASGSAGKKKRAIRGVSLAKDGGVSLTAACADGFARVLDLRKCGDLCDERFVGVGGLTCAVASECAKDVVYVGGEDGRVAELDWSKEDGATFFYDAPSLDDLDAFLSGVDSRNFSGETRDGKSPGVSCLSVAPSGGALAAGWDDGTVAVFAEK